MGWRRTLRLAIRVIAFASLMAAGCAVAAVWYFGRDLPDYHAVTDYRPPPGRPFVSAAAIPPILIHAFLAAEDRDFYWHPGIDVIAILRTALTDIPRLATGRRPAGASTITQQVVRMFLLSDKMALRRKVREALLALRIEQLLSKDQILELYLNNIYLGCGSRGIVEAARNYFGKSLDQVTLADAAFLAGLPQAPSHYDPWKFPRAAKKRRDWVIDQMVEDGYVSGGQAAAVKSGPLPSSTRAAPPGCRSS